MAQQKIQMEVGKNLPPLKNDLIQEKKREMEEYQRFKELKAKMREEKRLQKMREKELRKKSPHNLRVSGASALESCSIDMNSERTPNENTQIDAEQPSKLQEYEHQLKLLRQKYEHPTQEGQGEQCQYDQYP